MIKMQHQYFIEDIHRTEVIEWCANTMVQQNDYQWFPFYRIVGNKNAFRLDIFKDEDASAFLLRWQEVVRNPLHHIG